ncbi:MAG: PhoX family protein [Candidatus Thiodiazotropha taylori]|nr:PhoX family protein [Candidatus Thiodiazotropha taylori]
MKFQLKSCAALVAASLLLPVSVHADDDEMDFGLYVQKKMHDKSKKLFGIKKPLMNSAEGSVARMPGQNAYDLVEVAKGLKAKILTRDAGNKADMFSFWPNENDPSHLIFCIEGGDEVIGTLDSGLDKMNPSVQSVDLDDGSVTTILRGMNRCDGIRTTAWGSVLATEETSTGQAYEIINPLDTVNHTVIDRALGTIVTADNEVSMNVVKRDALPTMAWEGLTVLDNGVVIGGDELRPGDWDLAGDGGDDSDVDGGAIFKFVPDVAHVEGMIEKLEESPLASGSVYAFRASCREGTSGSFTVNYGQGCEIGNGSWVSVSAADARRDANNNGATGYYRPEDLHKDPTYAGPGVRFCWANTGREAAQNYGEVICGIDSDPMLADETIASVVVNRFVEGDADFNSLDNLAFQPHTGNLYVIEDHSNGDVFACLPDGADRDIKTDGCVRVLSVKDQSAEPTGFEFFGNGKVAVVAIQHSNDDMMSDYDDYATDDIVVITGFKVKQKKDD